jgi:hypothetical protein
LTTIGIAQLSKPDDFNVAVDSLTSKNDTLKTSVKSPTGAMIRSLIFPGWGQLYNKKYFKAILAFGAEIGLAANSIYLNQRYKTSETELEREFYINNRNLSNWYLLGVILFSMADAFVDAHLSDFDESPDLSFIKIMPICSRDDIGVKLSVCINLNRP